jgi:hypothetical protein
MAAPESVLKKKNKYYIPCDKDDGETIEDIDTNTIHDEGQKI